MVMFMRIGRFFLVFIYLLVGFYCTHSQGAGFKQLRQVDSGQLASISQKHRKMTIFFHGSGGFDESTTSLKSALLDIQEDSEYLIFIDWTNDSHNQILAPFRSKALGQNFCKQVDGHFTYVHIIGVSVGAFAANSCVEAIKDRHPETKVTIDLLDPFVAIGLDFDYGLHHFGARADDCRQYLNTDDPVPFTNKPIRICKVFDVTDLKPENIFGHDWPLIYFIDSIKQESYFR